MTQRDENMGLEGDDGTPGGGGGGGGWFHSGGHRDDDNDNRRESKGGFLSWLILAGKYGSLYLGTVLVLGEISERWHRALYPLDHDDHVAAEQLQVGIVIPVLNEESTIGSTLQYLELLEPKPHQVIVVDGGSTDRTLELVRRQNGQGKKSVVLVRTDEPGRAIQMNRGAHECTGQALVFLHSDTVPPRNVVNLVRRTLSDPAVVLAGFTPLLTSPAKTWWFMSAHNLVSSYLYPALLEPLNYIRGMRLLFGDQAMFCRKADFDAVKGFDPKLKLMEDADLCVRMFQHGRRPRAREAFGRGARKIRVLPKVVDSSGRRFERWGNVKSTYIHFRIALAWYAQKDPAEVRRLYDELYGEIRE